MTNAGWSSRRGEGVNGEAPSLSPGSNVIKELSEGSNIHIPMGDIYQTLT